VLYAFGGAGATHAPAFALDIVDEIIVPASQSVFCAMGAVTSDIGFATELAFPMRLKRQSLGADADMDEIERIFTGLEAQANASLDAQNVGTEDRELRRLIEMRFTRQIKTLPVPYTGSAGRTIEDFLAAYARRYGEESLPETAGFEFVTFVCQATGRLRRPGLARYPLAGENSAPARLGERAVYDARLGAFANTPVYDGERLQPANRIDGPAIVEYPGSTVNVLSGQTARVDEYLNISIRKQR